MLKRLTYGQMPSYLEYEGNFERVCPSTGTYSINHGSPITDDDPPAGDYTASELWEEMKRLRERQTDESVQWVSDILGTLGWEWI